MTLVWPSMSAMEEKDGDLLAQLPWVSVDPVATSRPGHGVNVTLTVITIAIAITMTVAITSATQWTKTLAHFMRIKDHTHTSASDCQHGHTDANISPDALESLM